MSSTRWLLTLGVLVVGTAARGQEVASGPEKGKAVPALTVFDATGPHQDKDVDYAAERKGKPTVYLFVRADRWDRPMARFLRKLDETVAEDRKDGAVVAVWVTDDPDKA